ncbi:hypothetical protein [Neobacillus sp. CF12]|uniref:hypothetical protein n=1 Tax=Neobacillus sp. CF12 TaxID=3055864 RepID=UPI0025A00B06|nr:hypothetical protein [Neobacillus sp. CF12]MDM5328633.1 hypothetical protein [Neobacillus sp. CF12]
MGKLLVNANRVIALGGEKVTPQQLRNAVERRPDGLVGLNSPKSGVIGKVINAVT